MSFDSRNYEAALKLMQKAVTPTSIKAAYHDSSETVQNRVYKSLKVWSMYADLEESFGTFKVHFNYLLGARESYGLTAQHIF